MEQRKAFSPAADRHSAASLSGCLWSISTFLPGSRISPVFVSHSSLAMAAIVSPCAQPRPSSPRNKSKTLLDTRAQAVWSAHSLHSCTLPLSGPWVLRRGSALQDEQTEHCVRGRVDKHVSLWVYPHFTVFIQETMQQCWSPYTSVIWALMFRWKFHPPSYSGFFSGWMSSNEGL